MAETIITLDINKPSILHVQLPMDHGLHIRSNRQTGIPEQLSGIGKEAETPEFLSLSSLQRREKCRCQLQSRYDLAKICISDQFSFRGRRDKDTASSTYIITPPKARPASAADPAAIMGSRIVGRLSLDVSEVLDAFSKVVITSLGKLPWLAVSPVGQKVRVGQVVPQ